MILQFIPAIIATYFLVRWMKRRTEIPVAVRAPIVIRQRSLFGIFLVRLGQLILFFISYLWLEQEWLENDGNRGSLAPGVEAAIFVYAVSFIWTRLADHSAIRKAERHSRNSTEVRY